jgi:LacI family repressor for deo operon, udp, cdd, tsx, nupC, and nupG
MRAYRQALESHGLAWQPDLVLPGNGLPQGGEQAFERLLALAERPSAVFCYNDMTAIGLLHAARQKGLRIPDDLAIVGFDDIPFAAYVEPPLTTIAQPKVEMGQLAMGMLLTLMEDRALANEHAPDTVVQGRLIVRGSA